VLRPPAQRIPSVVVLWSDRSKCRHTSLGQEGDRDFELKSQHSFRRDYGRAAAREEHAGYPCGGADPRTDPSALTSVCGGSANCRADACGGSDGRSVSTFRSTSGSLHELRPNRQLLAIDQNQIT
jgi:hypothetical protein